MSNKDNPYVTTLVKIALKMGGFDGLYTDECGCVIDDLAPCGEINGECRAGYKCKLDNIDDGIWPTKEES